MRRLARALLPPLLLAAVLAPPARGAAQTAEQEPEMTLPGCQIAYPQGFDPNTVGVVEGVVAALGRPERGPVAFRLETAGGVYTVYAAPAWYWEEIKAPVRDGDRVSVKGSKAMGADGKLYLIAQEITPAGSVRPVVLRNAQGKPAWSGCGPKGCGKRGR